jgi:hypothetical protein
LVRDHQLPGFIQPALRDMANGFALFARAGGAKENNQDTETLFHRVV